MCRGTSASTPSTNNQRSPFLHQRIRPLDASVCALFPPKTRDFAQRALDERRTAVLRCLAALAARVGGARIRRASQDGTLLEAEHLADLAVVWDSDEDSSRDCEEEERRFTLRLGNPLSSSLSVKKKGALGKLLSPSKTPDISPPGAGSCGQQNASLAFRASTNGKTPIAPSWNANSEVERGDGVDSDDDFVDPAEYERARQMLELEDREQAAAASSASNSSRLQLRGMNATGEGPASSSSTSTSASSPTASRYSYSEHHKRAERRVSLPSSIGCRQASTCPARGDSLIPIRIVRCQRSSAPRALS